MTVVLVLSVMIIVIILVLIFGGAEQRKLRKQEMKEEARREKEAKHEVKAKNKTVKKEARKYVDILDNEGSKKIHQKGTTTEAKNIKEEPIKPSEFKNILDDEGILGNNGNKDALWDKEEKEDVWADGSIKDNKNDTSFDDLEFNDDFFSDVFKDDKK